MKSKALNPQITEGVIWKQLLGFFFPILLGAFFQQLYNTVDAIIVGRYVGTPALAAVGSTGALINLITGFFVGLSSGATVLISQFYGARDRSGIRNAVHTGMGLSLVLGVIITVLGILTGPAVLRLTQTPENCMADASLYTRIYFAGSAASMIYNMGAGILRAMGDSKRPTIYLMITCFANIVLDFLLVVGLNMGVAGAAIATIASQAVSAALVLWALCHLEQDIALHVRALRLEARLLKSILYVGVPAGLQFVTFDLSNLLVQSGINSFGDVTMAAWTAYSKTDAMTWMISGAFGVSITTFVGQNFGAQRYDRIRKSIWVCMAMSVGLVGTLTVLVMAFRTFFLGIYTTDALVISTGASIMTWIVPYAVIFMPVEVFAGAMRGTGYSVMPTVITCTSVCLFRVVWIFTLVRRYHTLPMLALCYPISWVLAAVAFFITYLRGNWLKKRIEACGLEPEVR